MATITAGEFRNGKVFEMEGKYYQSSSSSMSSPVSAAFVRTKMKNVVTGGVTETSFNPTAKFEEVAIERKNMEYSYNDGDLYYFMDQETYDMVPLNRDMLGDAFRFVKENTMCMILSIKGNVFGVEPPTSLTLRSPRPSRALPATPRPTPQARKARDRRGDQGAAVHQHRRQDPDRHPHGRVYRPRQVIDIK